VPQGGQRDEEDEGEEVRAPEGVRKEGEIKIEDPGDVRGNEENRFGHDQNLETVGPLGQSGVTHMMVYHRLFIKEGGGEIRFSQEKL
jgi:hypothetical protein